MSAIPEPSRTGTIEFDGHRTWYRVTGEQIGGVVWLVIGVAVLLYYRAKGIGIRAEHAFSADERG